MSQDLESDFLKEVRRLKQKKKQRLQKLIATFFLILGVVIGFGYLFYRGILSLTNPWLLSIFGITLIFGLIIYVIKKRAVKKNFIYLVWISSPPKYQG